MAIVEILLGLGAVGLFLWLARRSANARVGPPTAPTLSDHNVGAEIRAMRQEVDQEAVRMLRELDTEIEREFHIERKQQSKRPKETHTPPPPANATVTAWSSRTRNFEVAGEWYRADNLRRLFKKHAQVSANGVEIQLPAVLVPDPGNPYDRQAVAVFVDGLHVGYMERGDARDYHRALAELSPVNLQVPSRQWLRGTRQDTWARVTLALPDPNGFECPNAIPANAIVLPAGSTIQVTREDQHLDALRQALAAYGSDRVVVASLRAVQEVRPRSTVEAVEVAIDGARVGVLTSTQTANLLPLVKQAERAERPLVCRAGLRGNSLKIDVALYVCKAHELSETDLHSLFG